MTELVVQTALRASLGNVHHGAASTPCTQPAPSDLMIYNYGLLLSSLSTVTDKTFQKEKISTFKIFNLVVEISEKCLYVVLTVKCIYLVSVNPTA